MLTHIGIIGMSVPYLVSLNQSGEEKSTATIPIEFVVSDAADEAEPREVSTQPTQKATAVEPDPVKPNTVATAKASKPLRGNDVEKASSQTTVNAKKANAVAKNQPTASVDEETPEVTPDPVTPEPASSSSEGQTLPNDNQPSPEAEGKPESVEPEVEDTEPEATGPEVIEGEPLSPPAPASDESGQFVAIRIGGFREDVVQDAPDVLPVLESDRELGTKNSETAGCGEVALPASAVSLVYRLRVGVDGSVELATLQPTGDGALVSEAGGRAIACLIETSGMTFSPAMVDGEAKLDDSLLVTFELTDVS